MGDADWVMATGVLACAALAALLWLGWRLRVAHKRIRALRHCYVDVTDWVVVYSDQIADRTLAVAWNDKLSAHDRLLDELGLPPLGADDRAYWER